MFTEEYAYFSSYSSSWLAHAKQYVDDMIQRFGLVRNNTVVEIAANDGYLLQYVKEYGIDCYGVEPTCSTAEAARAKGIEIYCDFFGVDMAEKLANRNRNADLIVANNVLAHVQDINDFVSGFPLLLKPHGVATFEFPHLLRMVEQNQFDTAYHEHFSYLSLGTVVTIFEGNGLSVFDVNECPTHGGSLRVFAQRKDSGSHNVSSAVKRMIEKETSAGLSTTDFYRGLQKKAQGIRHTLLEFLRNAKRRDERVAAYGAAAKGNTLMNFCSIGTDLVGFVADLSPHKQGKYMPGSHIPIVAEEQIKKHKPSFILMLPWNLRDEISWQLNYIREWGGRFVVPIPDVEIF